MIKFRLYYDKDKEQVWLNEMVEKGWAVEHFFLGFYTFAPCKPGEYIYQLDMLNNWAGERADYQEFMSELKIETVTQWWRWVYLRKKSADGPFELYTDPESMIAQYTRIRNFFKVFVIVELLLLFFELFVFLKTGEIWSLLASMMLGVFTWVLIRTAIKCNQKIIELRGGEVGPEKGGMSWWLITGLLLNAFNLIMRNLIHESVHITVSVLACVLMCVGIYQQMRKIRS